MGSGLAIITLLLCLNHTICSKLLLWFHKAGSYYAFSAGNILITLLSSTDAGHTVNQNIAAQHFII